MGGSSKSVVVGYKYYLGVHFVPCYPVDKLLKFTLGDRVAWEGSASDTSITVSAEDLFGGTKREGGVSGTIDVMNGGPTQAKNSYLVAKIGSLIPAYRGVFSLVCRQLYWGTNPYLKNPTFTVQRVNTLTSGAAQWYAAKSNINSGDLNPAHIIRECLTDAEWGMGYPVSQVDDTSFTAAADALYAESFGLSFQLTTPDAIEQFIAEVLNHINGKLYADPTTGLFTLKLIRDDYVIGDLPIFDQTNVISLEEFQRRGWGETINEITVVYRDRETNKDTPVTVHDLANIQIQGARISEVRQYPGIPNGELAARVAQRDLQLSASPLSRLKITVNRTAWELTPGDPFKFSWPKLGIAEVVFRVVAVDLGTLQNGVISVDAVEDLFSLPVASYVTPASSGWTIPRTDPAPALYEQVAEATYWELVGELRSADIAQLPSDAGFVATHAVRPSGDSYGYNILSRTGTGAFTEAGVGSFCATATLNGALAVVGATLTNQTVTIAGGVDLDLVEVNGLAYIGTELVEVVSVASDGLSMVINRGMLDTVPAAHPDNTRVWFIADATGWDTIEHADGELVKIKLLPTTSKGTLEASLATERSITMAGRFFRPYPPGSFTLNGARYPASTTGDIIILGAHRDRLQQTAYLVTQIESAIGPEVGTTYTITIYAAPSTVKHTESGLASPSFTYTQAQRQADFGGVGPHNVRITVEAVRDGETSWQKQDWTFVANDV